MDRVSRSNLCFRIHWIVERKLTWEGSALTKQNNKKESKGIKDAEDALKGK